MAEPVGSSAAVGLPLRRALLLMTGSSVLVPAAGLLTQPILAHALGVEGRGELAAGIAPAMLAVSVATLGLPDALTYYTAKHPWITRRAIFGASLVSTVFGGLCCLAAYLVLPFLSCGDARLGWLILVSMVFAIPTLVVGVLRGAATGRQMWNAVAVERALNLALRVVALLALLFTGELNVLTAVLVSMITPVVAGVVYWRLLTRPPRADPGVRGETLVQLVSYGNRVWLGSVAGMLLARIGQILMTPLAGVRELGLFSVAVTISDVPFIVVIAIATALFGVNSKERDADRLTLVARLTLLGTVVGCALMGSTVPFWIGPLFGAEFVAATAPTLLLFVSATLAVPGFIAATGVGAWGRPGLRSTGLLVSLLVNVSSFVLLVSHFGALGACWANITSSAAMSMYMICVAGRVMRVSPAAFVVLTAADVRRVWEESAALLGRVCGRRGQRRDDADATKAARCGR